MMLVWFLSNERLCIESNDVNITGAFGGGMFELLPGL